jgi:hypothetical protein
MRLLILAGLLAAPAASAQQRPPEGATGVPCPRDRYLIPADGRRKAEARRLGELPPGDLILGVWRTENGCLAPVIVREGVGAPRGQQAPPLRLRMVPRRW